MQILVCAATAFEVAATSAFIEAHGIGNRVAVLVTGVGAVPATYRLTKAVTGRRPDLVLQAGIAGCFDTSIPLCTTVAVLRENLGDLGVLENATFTSAFDLGLIRHNEQPWEGAKLVNPHTELIRDTGLVVADGVTVNEISTNEDRISYYKNGLEATVESMEGAALHFVGLAEGLPFLQIRTISNFVGERDKSRWMLQEANDILNLELQRVLAKLIQA